MIGADSIGEALNGLVQAIVGSYWAMLKGAFGSWDSIGGHLRARRPR